MMQPFERRALELLEPCRDDPAQLCQHSIEPSTEPYVEAVCHQMAATKVARISDQLIELETDRGIVRCDNGARAGTDDDVDGNLAVDELLQDAEVTCAAQTSST